MTDRKCKLGAIIGGGSYGTVYRNSDQDSVIKVWNQAVIISSEIDVLFRLRSPHLLSGLALLGPGECGPGVNFGVSMPLLTGQITALTQSVSVEFDSIRRMLFEVALGLQCLHQNRYLHLDISSNNVLYAGMATKPETLTGVLIDFGFATTVQRQSNGQLAEIKTPYRLMVSPYTDPQGFDPGSDKLYTYSDKSDIWALGILYLQILNGGPVPGLVLGPGTDRDAATLAWIQDTLVHNPEVHIGSLLSSRLPKSILDSVVPLLSGMLKLERKDRFGIDGVVTNPWFQDLTKDRKTVSCTTAQITLPTTLVPFERSRKQAPGLLISILVEDWPHFPAEMLFVATDILFRILVLNTDILLESEIRSLVQAAALTAHGLFFQAKEINPKYLLDSGLISLQITILKLLEGKIRRSYLYDAATSLEQLVYVTKQIILSSEPEVLNSYLYIDVPKLMADYDSEIKSKHSKLVTVQELLKEVNSGTYDYKFKSLPRIPEASSLKLETPKLSEVKARAIDQGYTYLITALTQTLSTDSTEVAFMAIDMYLNYCSKRVVTPDQAPIIGISCIIASHLQVYETKVLLPPVYIAPGTSLAWEAQPSIIATLGASAYANPLYRAATYLDQLRILYSQLQTSEAHVHYTEWASDPDRVLTMINQNYVIGPQPKTTTIEALISTPEPKLRS